RQDHPWPRFSPGAINCLDPQDGNPCNQCEICRGVLDGSLLDVVEMDAASNNSVDNIRRITDEVNFMPAKAHYKVYIIDEVHMLTPGAFNALLKTLENPLPMPSSSWRLPNRTAFRRQSCRVASAMISAVSQSRASLPACAK
ncbi:MAG: hypothetical protein LRY35_04360, partial [Clostridiales bacterium]|nr:hypothetical protein [Clostridiales bacterium]